MRILKGSLKGKNIVCPIGIRPVSVMVRRACFDILGEAIQGGKVLDLFAGSGSLGIESLSNGAEQAIFVDISNVCVETVKKNTLSTKIGQKIEVYLKDADKAIHEFFTRQISFDFIFLDPPYYKGMLRKTLQTLEEYDILTPSGYILCFCYIKDDFCKESDKFYLIAERKYGQTLLLIYRKKEK